MFFQGNKHHFPLLFLHGFLGCKEDWEGVIALLQDRFFCIAIDLPDYGEGSLVDILSLFNLPLCGLIGYSMGGRIALMERAKQSEKFPKVVAFSAHPGLSSLAEKQERYAHDLLWAEMLKTEPYEIFLEKWYAQELFASLKERTDLFEQMLKRRRKQNPQLLAKMLLHYSLAHQSYLGKMHAVHFVCGERDLKYSMVYTGLSFEKIAGCGHAVLLENPAACAASIANQFREYL